MKRKTNTFDISNAIRKDVYVSPSGNLGAFKDDLNLLNKSIEYLEKFNETKV
jgi:hypothetical protein